MGLLGSMGSIGSALFVLYIAVTLYSVYNFAQTPSCGPNDECMRPTFNLQDTSQLYDLYVYTSYSKDSSNGSPPVLIWSKKVSHDLWIVFT